MKPYFEKCSCLSNVFLLNMPHALHVSYDMPRVTVMPKKHSA